jgi:sugar phosphate isomerase/epimerase
VTAPGIPNDFALSTACFGTRLRTIEDQAFAAVAMGFRQIELGLGDAPPTMNGFEDTRRETGVRVTSIVCGCLQPRSDKMACQWLANPRDDEREQAIASVRRHVIMAQRVGAPVVVLRGGAIADAKLRQEAETLAARRARDGHTEELTSKTREFVQRVQKKGQRQIEHLCRSLHQVLREFPETQLALEPGSQIDDLLSFEAMGWVLDDLPEQALGYWHDVSRVHVAERMGLAGQGQWLDAYARRMLGVHLQDAAEEAAELPPGQGEVDFRLVAEYTPKTAARVVEVDPRHGRTEILASVQFLADKGF